MDDRLQRVEAKIEKSGADVRRLTRILSLFMLTLIALVVAAAMATDIFKVEYNGTTRFQVDDKGTATINADTNAADVALRILSAPNSRGDIRFSTRSSDPTNPQVGDLWYNSTEQRFKLFDGFKRMITFDGLTQTIDDATANNNDGTRGAGSGAGSDDPSWTTDGKLGGCALSFDGSDCVLMPTSLRISAPLTISAWVYPTALTSGNIFNEGNLVAVNSGYVNQAFLFRIKSGGVYNEYATAASYPVTNWYHIVWQFDGTNLKGWVNNNLVINQPHGGALNYSAGNDYTLGSYLLGGGAYFTGMMDEISLWNTALPAMGTPSVDWLYNTGNGRELVGNEAGLVSVWHLNDPK